MKRILMTHDADESIIEREVELMKKAEDHPNILKVIGTEMTDDFL